MQGDKHQMYWDLDSSITQRTDAREERSKVGETVN